MSLKSIFLINVFSLVASQMVLAQDLPNHRRYEWHRAGLVEEKFESQRTLNLLQFGADPTGRENSDLAFTDAMNEMGDQPGTLYFPAGTYF